MGANTDAQVQDGGRFLLTSEAGRLNLGAMYLEFPGRVPTSILAGMKRVYSRCGRSQVFSALPSRGVKPVPQAILNALMEII